MFRDKGVGLGNMRFSGLDEMNSMSGEITGLQRHLHYLSPHMKHINCRQLATGTHILTFIKRTLGTRRRGQCATEFMENVEVFTCKIFVL